MKKEELNPPCIYCKEQPGKTSEHFQCEVCNVGMCDECYDLMVEHIGHYHEICEHADDSWYDAIVNKCGHEPAYLCEECLSDIVKENNL